MARSDWKRPVEFPLADGHRRIRIVLSYDGSAFSGWQRQKTGRSVQEVVEDTLRKMLKVSVRVFGSGRTDAGVHAVGQVAHFDIANQSVPVRAFPVALNRLLPRDVRIRESALVDERFHARFSSVGREYRYLVKEEADYMPFDRDRVCRVRRFPPVDLLNAYAVQLVGTHDFSTFRASGDQSRSRIRDLYTSRFFYEKSSWAGDVLVYAVSGNAFLMHQVRSMVGTMLRMGERLEDPEEFGKRLAARDRLQAGKTAPPGGLYLYRIVYDDD